MQVTPESAVCVADWNRDGRLDLIAGDADGRVFLLAAVEDHERSPSFDFPRRLVLDEIEPTPHCDAAPLVTDWDGDGLDDLLVAYGMGNIVFYKGLLEQGVHGVATGEILLQPAYSQEPEELARSEISGKLEPVVERSHKLPKLAVFDWNGDGRLDLLVGDSFTAKGPEPLLSAEQRTQRDEFLRQQSAAAQGLAEARRPLREKIERELGPREKYPQGMGAWSSDMDERVDEADARDGTCQARRHDLVEATRRYRALVAESSSHGYVWVYLRK